MRFAEVIDFLTRLKANNNREWFEANKAEYKRLREGFTEWVAHLLKHVSAMDSSLSLIDAKDTLYRINRDVRFSANKEPYKTVFSAFFNVGGKKAPKAGYYYHIEPGNQSFVAGGVYCPEAPVLKQIRSQLVHDGEQLLSIINGHDFQAFFKAFEEGKLKQVPKDFRTDAEQLAPQVIELLKQKSHIFAHYFTDAEVNEPIFFEQMMQGSRLLFPYVETLNLSFVLNTEPVR
jgi:uncharacterized protein (TIGR02453 family)